MADGERIKVLLADDHRLLRDALRAVLEQECEIVGEADSGERAIDLVACTHPHVVLMDIGMRGMGGLAAAHRIAEASPATRVLILSQYDDEEYVIEALDEAQAAGYLLKTDAVSELLAAVRAVHEGRRYVSPSVAPVILARLRRSDKTRLEKTPTLTRREREVLRLIGDGATAKEIASRLKISPKTAQVHRDNLKQKLDLRTTADMVRWAIKHKIIRLE